MKKPKLLYHGSPFKLKGTILKPKKAEDLEKNKSSTHKGVYASSLKKAAIAMAILSTKGVLYAGLDTFSKRFKKAQIYDGWPKAKYIYLYTLPSETFTDKPKGSAQWVSFEPVRPLKAERLKVEDYLHLVSKEKRLK
ncbi:hypothetical protein GF378_00685 [Candidatus Pacearchaeota archaeon]|nr:hypothetical protein [Candidatus Pacearchaeota archaeon]